MEDPFLELRRTKDEMSALRSELREEREARQSADQYAERETQGIRDVAAERLRQIEQEGCTGDHDDEHEGGALADAAICYIDPSLLNRWWPWELDWYKPKDRRRNLVRAAALLIAEIDRLDRAGAREAQEVGDG